LLIADLYENPRVPAERQLSGVDNAILAPTFESLPREPHFNAVVNTVLVLFGGTDPSHLADKALRALESIAFAGDVLVVRGLGAEALSASDYNLSIEMLSDVKNMPALMERADIALSSAGRTITELTYMGVPTICMAQNNKELTHTHTTSNNGVLMLGLGSLVSLETLSNHLEKLITDTEFRKILHERAVDATAHRSNENVVSRMMRVLD
jgi:spore coat polysaccharide biosynthesis predicted glycosyltransferase SpsG